MRLSAIPKNDHRCWEVLIDTTGARDELFSASSARRRKCTPLTQTVC
jgi:hypothetical protein